MVDMYQTGIIITFILVISGSMVGVLAAIDEADDGIDFGIPIAYNSIRTPSGETTNIEAMITKINEDFDEAFSSSDLLTQTITGGGAMIQGLLLIANLLVSAFTSWIAIVDILFGFAVGTPIVYLSAPIKIALSIIIIYTILKFIGDMVKSLPFFGG